MPRCIEYGASTFLICRLTSYQNVRRRRMQLAVVSEATTTRTELSRWRRRRRRGQFPWSGERSIVRCLLQREDHQRTGRPGPRTRIEIQTEALKCSGKWSKSVKMFVHGAKNSSYYTPNKGADIVGKNAFLKFSFIFQWCFPGCTLAVGQLTGIPREFNGIPLGIYILRSVGEFVTSVNLFGQGRGLRIT